MNERTETVIWTRRVDEAAAKERNQKFLRFYVAPVVATIIIGGAFGGIGAVLGLLILFGLFGLLLGGWVFFNNVQYRQNPELRLRDGSTLAIGKHQMARTFDLSAVESWTTKMGTLRTSTYVPSISWSVSGTSPTAEVLLRFPELTETGEVGVRADGGRAHRIEAFFWLKMPESELDEVREVLAPHIDAPWVDPDRITD
ncbi:MAG: hypothetical protein AAGA99_13310 [Actinomycetota bacterium]